MPKPAIAVFAAALFVVGALSACSPLSVVNAVSPQGEARTSTGLRYAPGNRHLADIYQPAAGTANAPVIVFFYGGNWVSGDRKDYAFVGRALAARGFVVVIPDYRLYPEVRYPDFLDDSAQAVAWTRREIAARGGDPAKIFLMGHSAGAYNAAMLALDPRWLGKQGSKPEVLRGWIGLAGPYDFLPVTNRTTRPVFLYPDTPADSQPVDHVTSTAPPALLIAANSDNLVNPARNTGGLAARLRTAQVPVQEVYYDGVNHVTLVASLSTSLRRLAPALDAVEAFVRSDGGRQPASVKTQTTPP
ncbi:alpha/beta hydrolase [Telluria aromaticivorans]|uniref:Alpha/beta hydrolase n=1 Tax=Telluria aromaticivorans TaxID=2725995 RepID=A0A7Y2NZW5_9BURK|nr:alpha/beta hydrolase [Telluria aromaticivorans]NNG22214.1 alpha/beta hydrolase [Telluria aromaticivorans]